MMQLLVLFKRVCLFLLSVVATYLTYLYLSSFLLTSYRNDRHFVLVAIPVMLALYLFTAHIVLPAVHRLLVKVYLPDYFIGRSRTVDGLLTDPINLAVIGTKYQLTQAMEQAGWTKAEPLTLFSAIHTAWCILTNKSHPSAPVSSAFLFGSKQDIAFQIEVNNSPRERHHVRFWRTPKNWWLPGGYKADWLGAATYDRTVGFSRFTLQLTHRVASDIDAERDFVVDSINGTGRVKKLRIIKHFASGYHSRNSAGDRLITDGNLPFLHLN